MSLLYHEMADHDLAAWMDDLLTRIELRGLMEHEIINRQGDYAVFQNMRGLNLPGEHPTI